MCTNHSSEHVVRVSVGGLLQGGVPLQADIPWTRHPPFQGDTPSMPQPPSSIATPAVYHTHPAPSSPVYCGQDDRRVYKRYLPRYVVGKNSFLCKVIPEIKWTEQSTQWGNLDWFPVFVRKHKTMLSPGDERASLLFSRQMSRRFQPESKRSTLRIDCENRIRGSWGRIEMTSWLTTAIWNQWGLILDIVWCGDSLGTRNIKYLTLVFFPAVNLDTRKMAKKTIINVEFIIRLVNLLKEVNTQIRKNEILDGQF